MKRLLQCKPTKVEESEREEGSASRYCNAGPPKWKKVSKDLTANNTKANICILILKSHDVLF
jgi:hypothetical protein